MFPRRRGESVRVSGGSRGYRPSDAREPAAGRNRLAVRDFTFPSAADARVFGFASGERLEGRPRCARDRFTHNILHNR